MERNSFRIVSGESPKTMRKQFLSTKFPHQEIRRKYGIFCSVGSLKALVQIRLKGYHNNAINVRISLDGYGSKIWNVSRCRPIVSNETILATKHEFFFTKLAPVQSVTDIVLLGFD